MPAHITPPTRVSKIIHRERKVVAELITAKLKETNWDHQLSVQKLYSWLNGVAVPETNKEVKDEILNLRAKVKEFEKR